jgi:hypothetical protein
LSFVVSRPAGIPAGHFLTSIIGRIPTGSYLFFAFSWREFAPSQVRKQPAARLGRDAKAVAVAPGLL